MLLLLAILIEKFDEESLNEIKPAKDNIEEKIMEFIRKKIKFFKKRKSLQKAMSKKQVTQDLSINKYD